MDERGWTEYRLAKESGLAQSTITNMFNRNNAPTFSTLEAICGAYPAGTAAAETGRAAGMPGEPRFRG